MSAIITQDDRMAALLADAMELPEAEQVELSHLLSSLVKMGPLLDPESIRVAGNEGVRALFHRRA